MFENKKSIWWDRMIEMYTTLSIFTPLQSVSWRTCDLLFAATLCSSLHPNCRHLSLSIPIRWGHGWSWPCFDTTLSAFRCKSRCCYSNWYFSSTISIRKQRRFVSNKVNLSLTFTRRLGYKAHNCKMAYSPSVLILYLHDLSNVMWLSIIRHNRAQWSLI